MSAKTKHHKVLLETAHFDVTPIIFDDVTPITSPATTILTQRGRGFVAYPAHQISGPSILAQAADVGQPVFTVGQLAATEAADLAATLGEITIPRPASPRTEPPGIPEFLVRLCCTKKSYRDKVLGDLDEDFQHDLSEGMTIARARRKYLGGAIRSIIPQLWAAAKRVGIFGFIAYYARRLLQ
jgi:hypothetical protein